MSLVEHTVRSPDASPGEPIPRINRFGWQANICTLGSILTCFSLALLVTVVGALGLQTTSMAPLFRPC